MTTFATPAPITATVTTAGARIRITASDRPDTAVLVEPIDATNAADVTVAERTKVDFANGALSVRTTRSGDRDGSVAITIAVPTGSGLVLNTAWSEVNTQGRFGDCELGVSSGRVRLDQVDAVRGHVGASEVSIGHARSAVALDGGAGRIDIDQADADVTVRASDCPIRIGRVSRGRTELLNAAGGIAVGIAAGSAAQVDARSTKGTVRDTRPTPAGPASAAEAVTVHARTRRDDIVIQPAG